MGKEGNIRPLPVQNKRRLLKLYTTHSTCHNHPSQKRSTKSIRRQSLYESQTKNATDTTLPEQVTKRQVTHIHPTMRNILRRTQKFPVAVHRFNIFTLTLVQFHSEDALIMLYAITRNFFFLLFEGKLELLLNTPLLVTCMCSVDTC